MLTIVLFDDLSSLLKTSALVFTSILRKTIFAFRRWHCWQ